MGYMETFFNKGSMTMIFHILNVHEGLGGLALANEKMGGVVRLLNHENLLNGGEKNTHSNSRSSGDSGVITDSDIT